MYTHFPLNSFSAYSSDNVKPYHCMQFNVVWYVDKFTSHFIIALSMLALSKSSHFFVFNATNNFYYTFLCLTFNIDPLQKDYYFLLVS